MLRFMRTAQSFSISRLTSRALLSAALSTPFTALAAVDLVVNNHDTPDPVAAGGSVTYQVTVTNNSAIDDATGVKTVHSVSAGARYFGYSGTGVSCSGMAEDTTGPGTLNCTLPNLARDGGEVVFTIQLGSATAGNITLGATASADQAEEDPANNTLDESTTVSAGANMAMSVTPANSTVSSGSTISLALQLSNSGPDQARSLVVTTPVPTGLNITSVPAGCSIGGGNITCNVAGPISPDGNPVALGTITAQVIAAGGSSIVSSTVVQVSSSAPPSTAQDPDVGDNTALATINVTAGSDVKLTKARSVVGNLLVGDSLDFVLTPTYSGDAPGSVTVTDTVPSNYTIGSVLSSQNGWTCGVAGQTVTCSKTASGSAGLDQPLDPITIPVTATTAGSGVTNSASISGSAADPTPGNNSANDGGVSIIPPTVDLSVEKSGPSPGLVVAGVPFDYQIRAGNTGTTGYFGTITVTDHLPAQLTANSYSLNGWSCTPAAPVVGPADISCTRTYTSGAPLESNTNTPAMTMNVTASSTGTINNSVTITADCNLGAGNCGDGDLANYQVTSSVNTDSADVRVLKTVVGPDPIPAGDVLTYRLEVVNDGPTTSSAVVLTDTLADLINNQSDPTTGGYVGENLTAYGATGASCTSTTSGSNGRRLTCNFATIPVCTPGSDCPVVTVQVRPGGDGGTRSNSALVVSNGTADPDHGNDQATVTSTVESRADVTVTKNSNPPSVPSGQTLTYVVTATNEANGLSAADNVTLVDTLPLDVTFLSATPTSGSCSTTPTANSTTTAGNQTISCNLGTLNNGTQGAVTIAVRPNNVTRGTTITNNASVSTTTTEINTGNNTASADTVIIAPSLDLLINKVDTVDPVAVGDNTAYVLTVTNNGPSAADNVVVNDALPSTGQLSFQSLTTTAGSCTTPAIGALGGPVSCTLGYMAPGATQTVTITMQGVAKGVYNNTASLSSDEITGGFDINTPNNTDGETTTVRTKADMEVVSKTPSETVVNVRDNFNFVIRVRNNGPANEADTVQVSDTLPANMELTGTPTASIVSGTTTLNTCTGSSGATAFNCSLGTVSNGAVIDITVPVQITNTTTLPQTFTNTASVTTSSLDIDATNNSSSGGVTVNSSSLGGRVFVDHNNDGLFSTDDTGIAGVTITLTGTAFDGESITRTVVTNATGQYNFIGVPQGTYQLDEGSVSATEYTDGKDSAGTEGGDATTVNDRISTIALPANTVATGYNFAEVPVPRIGIAKSAGGVVNNGNGTYDVEFTLTVINAGNTPLSTVQVNDTLAGQFGSYVAGTPTAGQYTIVGAPTMVSQSNGAALTLAAAGTFTGSGAGNALLNSASSSLPNFGSGSASTAQIRFLLRFFPTTSGPFNNTATTNGTSPANTTATDNSVDGATPDANGNDDPSDDASPTIVSLDGQEIGLAKSVGTVVQTGVRRFRVPYTIVVRNLGPTATATNVQVTDNLAATFPTAQSITITSPATVSACSGTVLAVASPPFNGLTQQRLLAGNQNLQGGEECSISFAVEVDFGSNPLPNDIQNNQATATTSQSPGGTLIDSDLSDNGSEPDPNGNGNADEAGENDPTPVSFATGIQASISGKVYFDSNHDRVDNDAPAPAQVAGFRVRVFNGEDKLVGEAVVAADGTYTIDGLFPSTPGVPATYYRLQFVEPYSGAVYGLSQSDDPNPARNGTLVNGEITQLQLAPGVTTLNQNLPLDPSGVVYDSITREPVPGASVTLAYNGTPVPAHCVVGGMSTQVTGPTGFYQFLLNNPAPVGCPGVGGSAQLYTLQVVQPAGYLPPASAIIPPAAGSYTPSFGGVAPIQAQSTAPTGDQPTTWYFDFLLTLSGSPATSSSNVVNNHIPLDPILGGAIAMTKTTPLVNVSRSDLVPYTITATNTLGATLSNIDLIDTIPAGFRYRLGSASLNGVTIEPQVNGRNLRWSSQTFTPNERKTLRMILVVGSGVSEGEYVNRVVALNNVVGSAVSNTATAAVRVVPDPTFDCSDIIGKVFDDKNTNGYQDQGEPGIANVRVATPRGLLVTTDHEGRFHVACAEIPNQDRGSNFVMKLDERTLPTGYRITTENPRDVRVTRGKMVKLNFGATVHRVVRLELSDAAFENDATALKPEWQGQLASLSEQLQARPSILRIAYRRGTDSTALAQQRIDAVRQQIEDMWHKKRKPDETGQEAPVHPLLIETELEGKQ